MLLKGPWNTRSINRVPMIWSDPDSRTQGATSALASTIDISASILDRAGVDPYFGIQGKSFLPCILNGQNTHRDNLMVEFNDGFARNGFEQSARVRSLITNDWQLSVYKDQDWGELYDLKNDELQTHNLWNSAEHAAKRAELFELLTEQLISQMDESPQSSRLA